MRQSQGADQIREAMVRLSEGAHQTINSLAEFNKATDHLREAVGGLKEDVSFFTVSRSSFLGQRVRAERCPSVAAFAPRPPMRILRFQVGSDSFAVDFRRIVEVTPMVNLRQLPHAPAHFAGLFHYRGRAVPVVDLGLLFGAAPAAARLSTRIILVHTEAQGGMLLGLLAERVSALNEVPDAVADLPPVALPGVPYLGAVFEIEGRLVQLLSVGHILPAPLQQALALSSAPEQP